MTEGLSIPTGKASRNAEKSDFEREAKMGVPVFVVKNCFFQVEQTCPCGALIRQRVERSVPALAGSEKRSEKITRTNCTG